MLHMEITHLLIVIVISVHFALNYSLKVFTVSSSEIIILDSLLFFQAIYSHLQQRYHPFLSF
jgi:hypothetical protein